MCDCIRIEVLIHSMLSSSSEKAMLKLSLVDSADDSPVPPRCSTMSWLSPQTSLTQCSMLLQKALSSTGQSSYRSRWLDVKHDFNGSAGQSGHCALNKHESVLGHYTNTGTQFCSRKSVLPPFDAAHCKG